jgi:hypothetical protein
MIRGEAQVATDCQAIQMVLTEDGGGIDRLDGAGRQHLEVCPDCCELAATERALGLVFAAAVPPADPTIARGVLAALKPMRVRRRVIAFLPVAASLLVALLGAVMVGGVPGSGILRLSPGWSAQGWMAFATSLSDWGAAAATGARAAAAALDPAFLAGAGVVSFLGLVGVAVTALRWRRIAPWRDDG